MFFLVEKQMKAYLTVNNMNNLPNELLYIILEYLAEDVAFYATVCKQWGLAISADNITRVLNDKRLMLVSLTRTYKNLNIDGRVYLELHAYYGNYTRIPMIVPVDDAIFIVVTNTQYRLSAQIQAVHLKVHEIETITLYVKNNKVKRAIMHDRSMYWAYRSDDYVDILEFIKDLIYPDIDQDDFLVFEDDSLNDSIADDWFDNFIRFKSRWFSQPEVIEFMDRDSI